LFATFVYKIFVATYIFYRNNITYVEVICSDMSAEPEVRRIVFVDKIRKWKSVARGKVYYKYVIVIPRTLEKLLDLNKLYKIEITVYEKKEGG